MESMVFCRLKKTLLIYIILQNSAEFVVKSEDLSQCNSYSFIIVLFRNIVQLLVDCDIAVGHTATQRLVLQKPTKPTWFLQKFCRNCTRYDPVEPYILLQKTDG